MADIERGRPSCQIGKFLALLEILGVTLYADPSAVAAADTDLRETT